MQRFDSTIKEIIKNYDNQMNIVLDKSCQKEIVIFGAGQLGHRIQRILNEQGVAVKFFCDNNLGGQVDMQTGLEIVSAEKLKVNQEGLFILIAVFDDVAYNAVFHQLCDFGFHIEQLMNAKNIAEKLPISYLEQNIDNYKRAYTLLEDEYSKEVYLNRIKKAYLEYDISPIVSSADEEYFDKEIILSKDEVFVDCGGFDGETSARFADRVNGNFKKIIIFEPEESKKELIQKNLRDYNFDFYSYGLWCSDTVLKFDARGDCASSINEFGNTEIAVKTLDKMIFHEAPTFIKMDIEGAETEALKGCRKIIEEYKPKLAICIYHKPEDLFEIPIMIKEMCPEYKLIIRQYANSRFETVCYADK